MAGGAKETGTESEHAGSTAAAVAMQNLLRLLLEKDEFLNQYNHIEQLDLEISLLAQITQKVARFKSEIFIFEFKGRFQ